MILGMITTAVTTLTGTSIPERKDGSQTEGPRIAETTELGRVMIIHCGGEGEVEGEVELVDHPAEATTTMMDMEEVGEVVIQSTTGTGTGTMEGGTGVGIMTGIITIDEGSMIGLWKDRVCTDLRIIHAVEV